MKIFYSAPIRFYYFWRNTTFFWLHMRSSQSGERHRLCLLGGASILAVFCAMVQILPIWTVICSLGSGLGSYRSMDMLTFLGT